MEELTTVEILDIADGTNNTTDWTVQDCIEELKLRVITDEESPLKGGIHPGHPHL